MSVGFRANVNNNTASGATLTASLPSTRLAGDFLLLCIRTGSANTISLSGATTGWVQLGSQQTFAGGTQSTAVYYKASTTGSESALIVNAGATTSITTVCNAFYGVDPDVLIEDFAFSADSDASNTIVPAPVLDTTVAARVALFSMSEAGSFTAPTGFIERAEVVAAGRGVHNSDRGPDYEAGNLGPWELTSSVSDRHATWSIALAADPDHREPAWEATSASGSTGGGVFIQPGTPTAIQLGDLMLLNFVLSSTTVSVSSASSGWNLIESTFSGQARLYSYWKIYDGTIGQFDLSGTSVYRHHNSRFTSPHPTDPVDVSAENSALASSTVVLPSVTPSVDGLLAYATGTATTANQSNPMSNPSTTTERSDTATAGANGSANVSTGTHGFASSGVASSTPTLSSSNAQDWAAHTIVLASRPEYEVMSFGIAASGDDAHIAKDGASYPPTSAVIRSDSATTLNTNRALSAGTYLTRNALMRWDTSALPDGAELAWAILRVAPQSFANVNARSLAMDWYVFDGTDTDYAESALTDALAGLSLALIDITTGSFEVLLDNTDGIDKDGITGLRTHISGGSPGGSNNVLLASYDHATDNPPVLIVAYYPPTPPAAPTGLTATAIGG